MTDLRSIMEARFHAGVSPDVQILSAEIYDYRRNVVFVVKDDDRVYVLSYSNGHTLPHGHGIPGGGDIEVGFGHIAEYLARNFMQMRQYVEIPK